jgi:tetratricopeptide (TPR) repeat protein
MERFSSLRYSLPDTRRTLRDRLRKFLSGADYSPPHNKLYFELSDESVLQMLFSLDITFRGDDVRVREEYERKRSQSHDFPAFDQFIEDALIRVVWNRIYAGLESRSSLSSYPNDLHEVLRSILKNRFGREFRIKEEGISDKNLLRILKGIQSSPDEFHQFECASPEWVSARLWERMPGEISNPYYRLHYWADRWELIGSPKFIPSEVWGTGTATDFTNSVIELIRNEKGILGWPGEHLRVLKKVAHVSNRPVAEILTTSPPVPATLIDRYLWLERREFEHVRDSFDSCEQIFGMVNILLQDVSHKRDSGAPHPTAKAIFEICNERPELLSFVTTIVCRHPVLLADMLLYPPSCALACLLIADWKFPGSASDRELIDRDNFNAQVEAFTDGISIAAHFLKTRQLSAAEAASLLGWLYGEKARPKYFNRNSMVKDRFVDIVRSSLAIQEPQILEAIVIDLSSATSDFKLENPRFPAALDIISAGDLGSKMSSEVFVDRYLMSIRNPDYSISTGSIGTQAAFTLVKLAEKSEKWEEFLSPINVNAMVKEANSSGENKYIRVDSIARAIRAHLRILCRAVSVWDGEIPEKMKSAIVSYVHSGALDNVEKGRISAFSARYEQQLFNPSNDCPISIDFSRILYALSDSSRDPILNAILEIDEPLTLAQLLSISPPQTRKKISERISALSPKEAADVHTLPELQARINELLTAGAFEAAEKFMALERKLQTLGKVRGRETARLQADLRFKLYKNDYDGISSTEVPSGLDKEEEEDAKQTLDFYKALSEHDKPNGDLSKAEGIFIALCKRAPQVISYSLNLLAVRTTILLANNIFKSLKGQEQIRARNAILDAETAFRTAHGVNDEHKATHFCNTALLLLAIGQPDEAYQGLQSIPENELQERVATFSAVALFRMGQPTKAFETLNQAEKIFGDSDLLRAARAQIERGAPLDSRASTSTVNDTIAPIVEALSRLARLDPEDQARVLSLPPDSFDEFTISQVRAAMSSIVTLTPFFKFTKSKCYREDDITYAIREFMTSRLNSFLGWSFHCQQDGGYSARGNPGKRDLTIEKDSATLSVFEAVVCRNHVHNKSTKTNLANHFKKLFGYSPCRLFFHLTYMFISEVSEVIRELHHIAEKNAPDGLKFVGINEIPRKDSMPMGFAAEYDSTSCKVKVVFLVLDLVQKVQRSAAKMASTKKKPIKKQNHGKTKSANKRPKGKKDSNKKK